MTLFERIGGREGLNVLLHHFYADVRQHQVIGPIFNQRIHDWPGHLQIIGEFWARQTGGPSAYPGGMAAKHLPLDLTRAHFLHWLQLWEFNCHRNLRAPEAGEMIQLARRLAENLQRNLAVE